MLVSRGVFVAIIQEDRKEAFVGKGDSSVFWTMRVTILPSG